MGLLGFGYPWEVSTTDLLVYTRYTAFLFMKIFIVKQHLDRQHALHHQEGEEAWMLMRQKAPQHDPERQQLLEPVDEEPNGATPRSCADEDTCFIRMGPIELHYKVANPQVCQHGSAHEI